MKPFCTVASANQPNNKLSTYPPTKDQPNKSEPNESNSQYSNAIRPCVNQMLPSKRHFAAYRDLKSSPNQVSKKCSIQSIIRHGEIYSQNELCHESSVKWQFCLKVAERQHIPLWSVRVETINGPMECAASPTTTNTTTISITTASPCTQYVSSSIKTKEG